MNRTPLPHCGILFSFQIYGDFSGYSDIAIGTAKLFGFELMTTYGKHIHNIAATRHVPLLPLRLLASVVPTDRINHYSLDQVSKPMVLDISETRRLLDWEPTQSLEACLEELS